VPLGWETDRAVLPILRYRAHRAYLLCDPEGHPKRAIFLAKVTARLKRAGVEPIHVAVDTYMDLPNTIREVSRIVQLETQAGARVHVNVSASGKLAALGAALAAMAHLTAGRGSVYYVPVLDYPSSEREKTRFGMSRGMKSDPIELPLFSLRLPNKAGQLVLVQLLANAQKTVTYTAARANLSHKGFQGFGGENGQGGTRASRTTWIVRFYRDVVRPLLDQGLVESELTGRDRVLRLTRAGEYVACLSWPPGETLRLESKNV